MLLEEEIKRHAIVDDVIDRKTDKIRRDKLIESYGIIPNLYKLVNSIAPKIEDEINKHNVGDIVNTTIAFKVNSSDFIDTLKIILDNVTIIEDYETIEFVGSFDSKKSEIQDEKFNPIIIEFRGLINSEHVKDSVRAIIAHELTHAYEYIKKSPEAFNKHLDNINYRNIANRLFSRNRIDRALAEIFYYCDYSERSAYINQMYQEVKNDKDFVDDIPNVDVAMMFLRRTSTWKKINSMLNNAYILMNTDDDEWQRKAINAAIGMNKKATTFRQLQKIIQIGLNKFIKKFKSNVGKFVYDLYKKNKDTTPMIEMADGFGHSFTIPKYSQGTIDFYIA